MIVNIGNQAKRSSYFFFEFTEILDTLLDIASDTAAHLSSVDDMLETLRGDLRSFVDLRFDDFFNEDMPEDAAEIVQGQVNLLKTNLTNFINAVPTLFLSVPSINLGRFMRAPSIEFDWESMTEALQTKKNEIANELMSITELTDEFKGLLQSLNNTLIQPFLAIFENAIGQIVGDFSSTFTNPLQEL